MTRARSQPLRVLTPMEYSSAVLAADIGRTTGRQRFGDDEQASKGREKQLGP